MNQLFHILNVCVKILFYFILFYFIFFCLICAHVCVCTQKKYVKFGCFCFVLFCFGKDTYVVNEFYTQFALNGFFSVDSFFWLSGLLATGSIWRIIDRMGGKAFKNAIFWVPLSYLHRYLRLAPMMVWTTLFSMYVADQMPWVKLHFLHTFLSLGILTMTWFFGTILYLVLGIPILYLVLEIPMSQYLLECWNQCFITIFMITCICCLTVGLSVC